jgi:hypothetical protein
VINYGHKGTYRLTKVINTVSKAEAVVVLFVGTLCRHVESEYLLIGTGQIAITSKLD